MKDIGEGEVVAYIRDVIDVDYGGSQKRFAVENGISRAYVNDVLQGRREPGAKILDAIGLEKVVTYRVIKGDK